MAGDPSGVVFKLQCVCYCDDFLLYLQYFRFGVAGLVCHHQGEFMLSYGSQDARITVNPKS